MFHTQVVGKVSPWIHPDAGDAQLRADSEAALQHELSWASHLSLQAVMLPLLSGADGNANYARLVGQAGRDFPGMLALFYAP